MSTNYFEGQKQVVAINMANLTELAQTLLTNGPHKLEKTSRRVRALYDRIYIFDTTEARHVWEHPFFPQFYVPSTAVKKGLLTKNESVDKEESAFLATLKSERKSTDRVISFEKGPLGGLVRFEFAALGMMRKLNLEGSLHIDDYKTLGSRKIYQYTGNADLEISISHPKDPYKRIEILPSSRTITAKVDGVTIAESTNNQFLFETMLRTRHYMPKTAARWEFLAESETISTCPYKGVANYYNVVVNGKEYKDLVWWYKYPTTESTPIAGHMCFYNEKVDIYIDGVKEEK
ncbi:hypothetical protein MMC28_009236 [Mycoblastus sanguinarius]|nr:hypothetical protein [Mycoblastus sanguinarius]